jgi:peptide/nickel transport system ATP-binding protein
MTTQESQQDGPNSEAAPVDALVIDDLHLAYLVRGVPREVLRGVSFTVKPGEAYGLVGESGCGKSTTAYAAMRYLPDNGRITGGRIMINGTDVTSISSSKLRNLRAKEVSMVYQDPVAAMNPTLRIGRQVAECFEVAGHSKTAAIARSREALEQVRIADPDSVMERYPHQLSGGMLQRVVIAMALASEPKLLVLDEPTTGLDATVEAEVLDLIRALREDSGAAVLLIAHNLGVIRTMCDRVGVMYAGSVIEEGSAQEVFENPKHPYTMGLLDAIPRKGLRKGDRALFTIPGNLPQIGAELPTCVYVDRCSLADELCRSEEPPFVDIGGGHLSKCHHIDRLDDIPEPPSEAVNVLDQDETIIELKGVSKTFVQRGTDIPALVSIDLEIGTGETLGLVGESGSGKSTLAKTLVGIHSFDEGGAIDLDGVPVKPDAVNRRDAAKRAMQMVFQNPDSALNRVWSVRRILTRTVTKLTGVTGVDADKRVDEIAEAMRLSQRHLDMKPRQLSGGLKQRVAIARAFAGDPRLVVCDEPTSALDVSVQAAILNLLATLQHDERTSYLFISHDIGVVRYLADRVAVMYVGRIVELGTTDQMFQGPNHPYTEALLSAVPSVDGEAENRIPLTGEIPSPKDPPPGCVFHTRCHRVIPGTCDVVVPELKEIAPGHKMACHIPAEQLVELQARDRSPSPAGA